MCLYCKDLANPIFWANLRRGTQAAPHRGAATLLVSGEIAMRAFALLPLLLVLPACGLEPGTDTPEEGPISFGALTLSQESVDFGQVSPNDSGVVTLTLSNTGEIPLGILDAQIDTSFFLVEDAANMLPSEIEAGGELDMNLVFTPDREMDFEGTLTIVTDSVDASEVAVNLTGSGAEVEDTGDTDGPADGQLSLSTTSIDFGEVPMNNETSESLDITNTGDEDVLIINVQTSGDAFSYGGELALPYVLGAGETRTVSAVAYPTSIGSFAGSMTISSDATNPEVSVDLSASSTGEPYFQVDCECEATSGNLLLQAPTTSKVLTIANYGTASLSVSNVTFSNPSNACGTLTMSGWSGSKTVSAGDTYDLTFTYAASSTATTFCSVKDEVFIETNAGSATKTIKGQFLF